MAAAASYRGAIVYAAKMPDRRGHIVTALLDAGEQNCAQLIMNVRNAIDRLAPGEVLAVKAYDPSAQVDLRCWTSMTGHGYLGMDDQDGYAIYYLRRRGDSNGKHSGLR